MNRNSIVMIKIMVVFIGFFTSAMTSSLFAQNEVSEWILQKSIDETCSVFSPHKMTTRTDSISTDIGTVLNVYHVLQQSTELSPNFLFQMSYTLYPKGSIDKDSIDVIKAILETTVDNAVLMQNGELIYKSEKSYKDYPGMIWKTKYDKSQYQMKSEIYFANDHLYMLQVGSISGAPLGEAVDHFFDSFKIE